MDYNKFSYKNFADKYGVYNVNHMAFTHASIEAFFSTINEFKKSIQTSSDNSTDVEVTYNNLLLSNLEPLVLAGYQSVISTLQQIVLLKETSNHSLEQNFILEFFSKQGWGNLSLIESNDEKTLFKITECVEEKFSFDTIKTLPNAFTAGMILGIFFAIESDDIMKINSQEIENTNILLQENKLDNSNEILVSQQNILQ